MTPLPPFPSHTLTPSPPKSAKQQWKGCPPPPNTHTKPFPKTSELGGTDPELTKSMPLILNWPSQCHWSVRGRAGCWVLHCLFSHRVEEDWVCNISINAKYLLHNNTFYHHLVLLIINFVSNNKQPQTTTTKPQTFPHLLLVEGKLKKLSHWLVLC